MSTDERQPLEEQAERAKKRLLDNVDRLEERTEAMVSSIRKAKASVGALAMGAAAATALLGTAWFVMVMHRRKARSRKPRWSMPVRQPTSRGLASRLARELIFSGGTIAGTHLLRWGLSRYLPIEGGTADAPWTSG